MSFPKSTFKVFNICHDNIIFKYQSTNCSKSILLFLSSAFKHVISKVRYLLIKRVFRIFKLHYNCGIRFSLKISFMTLEYYDVIVL